MVQEIFLKSSKQSILRKKFLKNSADRFWPRKHFNNILKGKFGTKNIFKKFLGVIYDQENIFK